MLRRTWGPLGVLDAHAFFDGIPVKARASIHPSRDEVYTETLAAIEEKLKAFHAQQVEVDPALNTTPVELTKSTYAADNGAVDARRSHEMKPVAERQSTGDPEARFQRGKHNDASSPPVHVPPTRPKMSETSLQSRTSRPYGDTSHAYCGQEPAHQAAGHNTVANPSDRSMFLRFSHRL
jgi:hypothetical protein